MNEGPTHREHEERPERPDAGPERARRRTIHPFTPFPITPWFFESRRFRHPGLGRLWSPKVDISDRGDTIVVRAELPGVEAKDIGVSVQGNVVTIEGEREQSVEVRGERYFRRECSYGRFRRDIRLHSNVNAEGAEAEFRKGVLSVALPKSRTGGRGRIEVREE